MTQQVFNGLTGQFNLVNAGAGSGSVTSVGTGTGLTGGPITGAGTISIANNTANTLAGYNASGVFSDVTVGSGLTLSGGTITASAGGSPAFNTITSGTNTTAAMIVGTGASLAASGSGTIAATTVATNANLTGPITSVGNATTISNNVALPGSPTTTTQSPLTSNTTISTTAYTDAAVAAAIAGVNPATAVSAATIQASDTSGFTYNNGASGIGATFTGTTNTAITIDGFTFTAVGQRLLVKNDTQSTSGAFNGVYYVTQVQTGLLPPILTRALDYDQPSDMNSTGSIPVINGTVNANTSWLLTSNITTVGTSPLTYTQFSLAPSTLVTLTGTQTLTNKRITQRVLALSANSATPAINTDSYDVVHITAQTAAITSLTSGLSGTPVDGDRLRISITGTAAVALTFGTSFESSTVTLPTTTIGTSRLDIGFFWNTETSKWRCTAVA